MKFPRGKNSPLLCDKRGAKYALPNWEADYSIEKGKVQMKTEITEGMLVTPVTLPVANVSRHFASEAIKSAGPFRITGVCKDPDNPNWTLINLAGYPGSFPADAFCVTSAKEYGAESREPETEIDMMLV